MRALYTVGSKGFKLGCALTLWWGLSSASMVQAQDDLTPARPNFLIIVADDLGWSDLGAFGGEIHTPNLDRLAASGLSMTQFYAAPTCSPTRSMLLTGLDNHAAGVGVMEHLQAPNQMGHVNYGAQLHDGVVTVAEVLQRRGYDTIISGKWHLAMEEDQYPHRRGFAQSFVLLEGGASHFADAAPLYDQNPVTYLENGAPVTLRDDFYSSVSYTDKAIEYLSARDSEAPFLAYLAYTAPHDPLQVPEAWEDRYKGVYDEGPRALRDARVESLRERGLFPKDAEVWRPRSLPAWLPAHKDDWADRSDEERASDVRPMEIYAAMVELLDQQIGRVIAHLRETGELENTYIIFMSDNGANAATPLVYPGNSRDYFLATFDNSLENMGRSGSHVFMGREWAAATGAPWKNYKGSVNEGGIRVPLIVSGPGIEGNQVTDQIGRVMDITPTILSIAGVVPMNLQDYDGKLLPQGETLLSIWTRDAADARPRPVAAELFGGSTYREDQWKAVSVAPPMGDGIWQLFNIEADPGETIDLAEQNPEVLQHLIAAYDAYAKDNGIIVAKPPLALKTNFAFVGECNWWCEFRFQVADSLAN